MFFWTHTFSLKKKHPLEIKIIYNVCQKIISHGCSFMFDRHQRRNIKMWIDLKTKHYILPEFCKWIVEFISKCLERGNSIRIVFCLHAFLNNLGTKSKRRRMKHLRLQHFNFGVSSLKLNALMQLHNSFDCLFM